MILIDNDSAKRVLGMADCIAALEDAYAEEVKGTAATRTKSQMHLPTSYSERWYRFSSTEGGLAHAGVVAIRIKSDVLSWPTRFGQVRAYNYCMETRSFLRLGNSLQGRQWRAAGDFERRGHSASQGRSHRGHRRQVHGARDASVLGILGSGGMAESHTPWFDGCALAKIYSLNREHREGLVAKMRRELPFDIVAVDSPHLVVKDSDIVASCTDAGDAILFGD